VDLPANVKGEFNDCYGAGEVIGVENDEFASACVETLNHD